MITDPSQTSMSKLSWRYLPSRSGLDNKPVPPLSRPDPQEHIWLTLTSKSEVTYQEGGLTNRKLWAPIKYVIGIPRFRFRFPACRDSGNGKHAGALQPRNVSSILTPGTTLVRLETLNSPSLFGGVFF